MKLEKIAHCLNHSINSSVLVKGFSIDSRKIEPGFLFIALKGERFDGHDFIPEALARGAVAVICERTCVSGSIPQFLVEDSIAALAKIAKMHRQTISCPIIALTGSNGKTSVKEMISSILPKPSFATLGNMNNHIGAPLNVLQLKSEHRYAVFELGANHIGEIAYTVDMVQPNVSLINNIAPAHIEGFGTLEGVALAKGEIYQGLTTKGTAIVNDDDDFSHFWDEQLHDKEVIRFSTTLPVEIQAKNICLNEKDCASFTLVTPVGETLVTLQIPGEHSIRNALAAASCCYAVGIPLTDIAQGLSAFQGVPSRMTFLSGKNHSIVIDDTYNANLRSVLTAVDVLAKRNGRRILVLGDLGELGKWTREHHEEIGHVAKNKGIDGLFTCGSHSEFSSIAFGENAKHYQNKEQLVQDLLLKLDKNTTILVKGSRAAAMEKIVHQLVSESA